MKGVEFLINSRIEVVWGDEVYRSTIQDKTDKYIAINILVKDGIYITPEIGDQFEALYYLEDEVYRFDAVVIDRKKENNIPLICIGIPRIVTKIQRREHVRVSIVDYIQFVKLNSNVVSKEIEDILNENNGKKAIVLDISGGGFRIKTSEEIQIGDVVICDLKHDDVSIRAKGQVVRVTEDEDKEFICGIRFIDIAERNREAIIRLIFSIMRDRMKKQ